MGVCEDLRRYRLGAQGEGFGLGEGLGRPYKGFQKL